MFLPGQLPDRILGRAQSALAEMTQSCGSVGLADAGAAVSLAETEIDRLGAELDRLRADEPARLELGRRAHELGAVHRSDRLARLIEQIAGTAGWKPRTSR